ncbi:MAG: FliM/FliN family flagellar motor switch protein [Polyangiaceae bacterium]|nr:FliM/FliN family flagellar motor switch protein [Polyangiaceae bacterium]
MRVSAFPWASLERLPRDAHRELGRARRALARTLRVSGLARAASELLSVETALVQGEATLGAMPADADAIAFETAAGARIAVALEPALGSAVLGRVLGRPPGLTAPGTRLDATAAGALAAVAMEIARRSGVAEALAVSPRGLAGETCVQVTATVLFDGRPYAARAWVKPGPVIEPAVSLAELGEIPIALAVVAARGLATPGELAALAPGDAWLPGAGWWIDKSGAGRAALAAPASERGVSVVLATDGRAVVGDGVVELSLDVEGAMSSERDDVGGVLAEAVLDAPLVVRVEIGTVSLTAREWAAMAPGDVIETGRRINEPVVLRVGGREVARGELVEVEGELGVRIREIVSGGTR